MELALEPVSELEELIVPESTLPKPVEYEPEEPAAERMIPELALNLGAMIVQLAIDDYRGADEREHQSAALFLFPRTKAYENHFAWAIGQTDMGITHARRKLEALRPLWDSNRKKRRET